MKKFIIIVLLISYILSLLISCSFISNRESLAFSFDSNGNYTGFKDLPIEYTIKDAEKEGCFVTQDGEVVANDELWDEFIENALQGENVSIRMVNFYTDGENTYFSDLFHNDNKYYLFSDSSENHKKQPYLHLLSLRKKKNNIEQSGGIVALTDDKSLTYSQVWKSLISSNRDDIKTIPKYEIVRFWY